jgi:hypothetical protein
MGLSRVSVQEGDRSTDMSVAEFLALPLDRRVRLVLEQQIQFFDEAGRRLATAEGVKLLRGARDLAPAT